MYNYLIRDYGRLVTREARDESGEQQRDRVKGEESANERRLRTGDRELIEYVRVFTAHRSANHFRENKPLKPG